MSPTTISGIAYLEVDQHAHGNLAQEYDDEEHKELRKRL